MTKTFCDRCGNERTIEPILLPPYRPDFHADRVVELCRSCYRELREFVDPLAREARE